MAPRRPRRALSPALPLPAPTLTVSGILLLELCHDIDCRGGNHFLEMWQISYSATGNGPYFVGAIESSDWSFYRSVP
jgi:hypothetical protein